MTKDRTNSELLSMTEEQARKLTGLDRQRRYILQQFSLPKPCPNCHTPVDRFVAAGIDIDEADMRTESRPRDDGNTCPHCKRGLVHVLPMLGGWHWSLVPALPAK